MDERFVSSVLEDGDFRHLFRKYPDLIKQVVSGSNDRVLHLAAQHGDLDLVQLIVFLRRRLVFSEDEKLETPLYVAAREGRLEIVKYLLQVEPGVAFKLNRNGDSVLAVAYESGKHDVVNFLVEKHPWMQMMMGTTPLQAPASRGRTDVLKEMPKVRPDLARKKDSQGCTPLFLAHIRDHLKRTRELLRLEPNLVSLWDNQTLIEWATIMKGHVDIINEIFSTSLPAAGRMTNHGMTLSPKGSKNWLSEGVKHPEWPRNAPVLLNMRDGDGNGNRVTPYEVRSLPQQQRAQYWWDLEKQQDKHLFNAMSIYSFANVLIASVAYPAVLNPPGGFEEFFGKATMGTHASFIVFLVANTVAFFSAISAVALHVNAILSEPKSMAKLSAISSKLTSMALISLAVAYTASAWTILPKGPSTMWVRTAVVCFGVGAIGSILLGVGKGDCQKRKRENNAVNDLVGGTQEKEVIFDRGSSDSASTSAANALVGGTKEKENIFDRGSSDSASTSAVNALVGAKKGKEIMLDGGRSDSAGTCSA